MGTIHAYMVRRSMIDAKDTSLIVNAGTSCIDKYQTTGIMETIDFGISGYENDPRHLCTKSEVRSWCSLLCSEFPIFLLIGPTTIAWFSPCILEVEVVETKTNSTLLRWPDDWYASVEPLVEKALDKIWGLSKNKEEAEGIRDEMAERCRGGFKLIGLQ